MRIKLLLLLPLLALLPHPASAQVINAASCSSTDMQTAFNAVVNSTTTVNIPAGTCHWTTQVTLIVPSGSTTLTVSGQSTITGTCAPGGSCAATDSTIIIDDYNSNGSPFGISTAASGSLFRLTGITIQGGVGQVKYSGFIGVSGNSQNVRFDHSHYNTTTYNPGNNGAGMRLTGCLAGVIDHNILDLNVGGVNNGFQTDNAGTCYNDSLGIGDQSWAHSTSLGSSNFLFMENNVFNNGASNDCTNGGRFVSRYNTFNSTAPPPSVQTHPTGGAGRIRGCRAWEVYNNLFQAASSNYINAGFFLSSGTGVIWGNTLPSSSAGGGTGYGNFITIHSMRRNSNTYGERGTPNGWGYCGTSFNGTGSNWDQNRSTSTGYRCFDQPGQGVGDFLTGGFSYDGSGSDNVTNNATGCTASAPCAWPREALEPVYEWLDNYSAVPNNPSNFIANYEGDAIFNNSDYYLWCSASSASGCTSFTGATGVGSGLLSARPSTCTVQVGYWATDTNTLYLCKTTNTWTASYTPYTYPHPLIGGSVAIASFSPTSVAFANQTISTSSAPIVVTLTNTGSATLTGIAISITGVNAADYSQTNTCGATLAASSSCTISVTFSPGTLGTRIANISITDSATGVPLSGTSVAATAPFASFSPSSVTFANQTLNTSSSASAIILTNSGTATMTGITISITGANAGDFSQTNNCTATLTASSSCTINTVFKPTILGTRTGNVSVSDNAPGSPQVVGLSGTGVVPTAPGITLTPASLAFGNQTQGVVSQAQVITLLSSETANLTVSSVTITGANSGDFSQTNNCVGTLVPAQSCTINVTFTPTSTGARSASVSVADNAAGNPHTVPLAGTGITAPAPPINLRIGII
jgi:Abnormal spindle-like microcephaly-assoc'd, ASPM-SPD-2-Hydin